MVRIQSGANNTPATSTNTLSIARRIWIGSKVMFNQYTAGEAIDLLVNLGTSEDESAGEASDPLDNLGTSEDESAGEASDDEEHG